jgi:hypothetical protein
MRRVTESQDFASYAERVRATMAQVATLGEIGKKIRARPLSERSSPPISARTRKAHAFYLI